MPKLIKANECTVCGRQLTDPVSIARGAGDECASKQTAAFGAIGTSDAEMAALLNCGDENVARLAQFIRADICSGNKRSAAHWLASARKISLGSVSIHASSEDSP